MPPFDESGALADLKKIIGGDEDVASLREAAPWKIINPAELSPRAPAEREWIAQDWVPMRVTTALYADGGLNKTLLFEQLMTSTAIDVPWLGLRVRQCRSFGLFCEDEDAELHRRQVQICDQVGAFMSDLEPMRWVSGFGYDNVLAVADRAGRVLPTPNFVRLETHIKDHGAELAVLDTAADIFAGNENDRQQVRQFVGLLNGMAGRLNCAVIVAAHPSRTGLKSGDIDGGSTAWNNSVRSRLSIERPNEDDPDERLLTRRKSNYSRIGETIRMRWERGMLVPMQSPTGIAGIAHDQQAETVFLELLEKTVAEGRPVSGKPTARNGAAAMFGDRPDRKGVTEKEFKRAMERLFAAGKIRMVEYGKASGRGDRPSRLEAVIAQ